MYMYDTIQHICFSVINCSSRCVGCETTLMTLYSRSHKTFWHPTHLMCRDCPGVQGVRTYIWPHAVDHIKLSDTLHTCDCSARTAQVCTIYVWNHVTDYIDFLTPYTPVIEALGLLRCIGCGKIHMTPCNRLHRLSDTLHTCHRGVGTAQVYWVWQYI